MGRGLAIKNKSVMERKIFDYLMYSLWTVDRGLFHKELRKYTGIKADFPEGRMGRVDYYKDDRYVGNDEQDSLRSILNKAGISIK